MDSFFEFVGIDKQGFIKLLISIAINLIVLFCSVKLINFLFKRWIKRIKAKGKTEYIGSLQFSKYLLLGLVYLFCIASVAGQIPALKTLMTSLLAGSGVLALVVGFASQEAVGNIASGFLITVFKPFKVGDVVRYVDKDITGVVEEISLRHTIIRTFENKRVVVPNGTINKEVIENANYGEEKVCIFLDVGISYESDIDNAMKIMAREVRKHKNYLDNRTEEAKNNGDPEVLVRVTEYGDSAVQLRAWVWAESSGIGFQMKSDLLRSIKLRFDEEGIDIAYPHRTVILKNK